MYYSLLESGVNVAEPIKTISISIKRKVSSTAEKSSPKKPKLYKPENSNTVSSSPILSEEL